MKNKSILVVATAVLLFSCAAASFATTASFQGLGDLPGGSFVSAFNGISADGSVVVGNSRSERGYEAFRWTSSAGMVGLGVLPGSSSYYSQPTDVSADGLVVVGRSKSPSTSGYEAFRWTPSGGMQGLGDLPGGYFGSWAYGVSANGSVVVGYSRSASGMEAFCWKNGVMSALGDLPGGDFYSVARSVSDDGSVVVGTSNSALGNEAVRWENGEMTILGDLPGGDVSGLAYGISADGSVVVGISNSAMGTEAFRWENGVMIGLGDLPGGDFFSSAKDVSADGAIIVGMSKTAAGLEPFIWDADNGMRNLRNVMEEDWAFDLTGWEMVPVYGIGISDNGLRIGGGGKNPDGNYEAWIATIPEPAVIEVDVDIKPGSCPNPLNVKSSGVLPVAVLGSADVNVLDIDPTSIAFSIGDVNVGAIRCSYEDVAAPVLDANDCNCTREGPDGFLDLTLKFKTQKIVEAVGDVNDGDVRVLTLTGVLFDPMPFETPIEGADCILIRGRHKPINPADINKDGVVDMADFAIFAQNWLQSSIIDE